MLVDPKVEVFQPSQKEKFGIGSQLRKWDLVSIHVFCRLLYFVA